MKPKPIAEMTDAEYAARNKAYNKRLGKLDNRDFSKHGKDAYGFDPLAKSQNAVIKRWTGEDDLIAEFRKTGKVRNIISLLRVLIVAKIHGRDFGLDYPQIPYEIIDIIASRLAPKAVRHRELVKANKAKAEADHKKYRAMADAIREKHPRWSDRSIAHEISKKTGGDNPHNPDWIRRIIKK